MRDRQIVLRLRLPAYVGKRWVIGLGVALVCVSALSYAALTTFAPGQTLLANDLTTNFNKIAAHTHPMSVGVTNQVPTALSVGSVTVSCATCPAGSIAIGGNCRVTPFPDAMCDAANMTLVGAGVDISYPGGVASNSNSYCCRGLLNANPGKVCNLGAWALCVSPTTASGIASQQAAFTTTASY